MSYLNNYYLDNFLDQNTSNFNQDIFNFNENTNNDFNGRSFVDLTSNSTNSLFGLTHAFSGTYNTPVQTNYLPERNLRTARRLFVEPEEQTTSLLEEKKESLSSEEEFLEEETFLEEKENQYSEENPLTDLKISSPKKYYPFSKKRKRTSVGTPSNKKRITADLSPNSKSKTNLIYKIKNTETGQSYTGKTGQKFSKRLSGHQYGINHPERDVGKKELYREIRANPEKFVIGIQCEEKEAGVSLNTLERVCISANNSFENGYNQNRGEGGGATKAASSSPLSEPLPPLTEEQARTPTKSYPIAYNRNQRLNVQLSPNGKNAQNVVYGFKNVVTGEWLIGETEQVVKKRMGGYNYAFNHPEKDCGKLPLPTEVRNTPDAFRFYILEKDQDNLKEREKIWIAAKDAFTNGYNQNQGGGGSSRDAT